MRGEKMNVVTLNDVLPKAKREKYAVGHFNINGLLWIQAILETAQEESSPVIVASSDRMVDYLGGFKTIYSLVTNVMDELDITVPVVLHLDHGQTIARCKEAVDAGYSSVMFDGSHQPIEKNVADTRRVADYAHARGVSVEGEVGTVGGNEDGVIGGIRYAKLSDCERIVREAHIDALAAALGSVHGKYVGPPKLGFKEMETISNKVPAPLVLHGASGISSELVRKAIQKGHAKININTELNVAFAGSLKNTLKKNPAIFDPKALLSPAKQAIKEAVRRKIHEFGSNNKQ